MTKKIKVQLTSKKSRYVIDKQVYCPGDVFEIDAFRFDSSCMVKIEEPKKPVKPPKEEPKAEVAEETVEATETATVTDEGSSKVLLAQAAPKVRKRKS
jgi:hypothetical protein